MVVANNPYVEGKSPAWLQWVGIMASVLLFIPLLVWKSAKWAVNVLRRIIVYLVIATLFIIMCLSAVCCLVGRVCSAVGIKRGCSGPESTESIQEALKEDFPDQGRTVTRYSIVMPNYAHLDTLEVTHPSQESQAPSKRTYIITFPLLGDSLRAGNLEFTIKEEGSLKNNLIFFNYPGMGKSTGWLTSDQDFKRVGMAIVEWLLQKGILAENIIFKGMCLAAAAATLAAAECHRNGIKVKLVNIQSFSSTTALIMGIIEQYAEKYTSKSISNILKYRAYPLVKDMVTSVGFPIEAGEAYEQIPEPYKTYAVIRAPKKERELSLKNYKLALMRELVYIGEHDPCGKPRYEMQPKTIYVAVERTSKLLQLKCQVQDRFERQHTLWIHSSRLPEKCAKVLFTRPLDMNKLSPFLPDILRTIISHFGVTLLPSRCLDDETISHSASLHAYLPIKNKRKQAKQEAQANGLKLELPPHKMTPCPSFLSRGRMLHSASLRHFGMRKGDISASDLYQRFVQQPVPS